MRRIVLAALLTSSLVAWFGACGSKTETKGTQTGFDRAAVFDTVWQRVNDHYFDPSFGSKDWWAMRERYRPLAVTAATDSAFYKTVNEMLFELGVSHLGVVPPDMKKDIGSPGMSAGGALGLDVRLLDGEIVITSVAQGSPADTAGIKPGFILRRIWGETIDQYIEKNARLYVSMPPFNDRNKRGGKMMAVLSALYGDLGEKVSISYEDFAGGGHDVTLGLAARGGRSEAITGLPPSYLEFESKRLTGGIGYIRFNSFHPGILEQALAAIDAMADAPGLVIDLRGNPGGVFPVRKALAEKLVGRRVLFWKYERRGRVDEAYLDPVENPYTGRVVVLVDLLSGSSSEEFAASLQAIGRAVVVGEQTVGRCLIADFTQLPGGAIFFYPVGRTVDPAGRVIEGNGVTPDIEVPLDRAALSRGIDSPLEAAVRALESE